jgi:type IV pilus assembly protein PilC
MVKAGEIGGALDQVLDRLAQFAEKSQALRAKVTSALYYPATVVVLASVIVAVVLVFVIPRFQELWDQADADFPKLTAALVAVSYVVRRKCLLVITGLAALAVLYHQINRTRRGHYLMDALKLRIPGLGNLIQKAALARFARTFATLLDTGVPILQSLLIVKDTAGNEVLARAVLKIHSGIREGGSLSEPMMNHPVFPPLLVHMISVGEETGAVDEMLGKVADTYEREVDSIVNGLTSLLEPLLIVFLGVVIGLIVVALYLPIFEVSVLFRER